ncbi:unnamed protein product [Closterium sp. Naga37s-1]|nr:unnamed protein product [Closterium sp. Naga37s-1]
MSRTVTNRVARAVHALLLAARSDNRSDGRRGNALLGELRRLKKLPAGFLRSVAEELWRLREFKLAADVLESVPPAIFSDNRRSDASDSSDSSDNSDSEDSEESEDSKKSDFPARGGSSPEREMTGQQRTCGSQRWTGGTLRLHARVAAGLVAANQVERGVQLIGQMPRVHTQVTDSNTEQHGAYDHALGMGVYLQATDSGTKDIRSTALTAEVPAGQSVAPGCVTQPLACGKAVSLPILGRLPVPLSPAPPLWNALVSQQFTPSNQLTAAERQAAPEQQTAAGEPAAVAEQRLSPTSLSHSSHLSHTITAPARPLSYASGCALIVAFGEVGVVDGAVAMLLCMAWGWDEPTLGCESRIPNRALRREAHVVLLLAAALARCSRPDDALALLRFVLQSGAATWQGGRGQVAVAAREAGEAVMVALARERRWGEMEEVGGTTGGSLGGSAGGTTSGSKLFKCRS